MSRGLAGPTYWRWPEPSLAPTRLMMGAVALWASFFAPHISAANAPDATPDASKPAWRAVWSGPDSPAKLFLRARSSSASADAPASVEPSASRGIVAATDNSAAAEESGAAPSAGPLVVVVAACESERMEQRYWADAIAAWGFATARLDAVGIDRTCDIDGAVNTVDDLSDHKALRRREIENSLGKTLTLPAPPVRWMTDLRQSPGRVPEVGEHTERVRREFLG